ERSQQIEGAGQGELRRAESRDEVAAPDAAVLLQPLEDRIDQTEPSWHRFDVQRLARQHAVPRQQLLRHGRSPFRGISDRDTFSRAFTRLKPSRYISSPDQRPPAFGRRWRETARTEGRDF